MYKFRKHRIKSGHALDRRKLKENFLQLASRLNEIEGSSISRLQFDVDDFRMNAFIEFSETGYKEENFSGIVSGDGGETVLNISADANLGLSGDYALTWNAEATIIGGDGFFLDCVPVMGNQFIPQANDCYYHFGYLNNFEPTKSYIRSAEMHDLRHPDDDPSPSYEASEDVWNEYGKFGLDYHSDLLRSEPSDGEKPAKYFGEGNNQVSTRIHLSGFGYVNLPRSTGKASLAFYGHPGSRFKIDSARISLRKRNR